MNARVLILVSVKKSNFVEAVILIGAISEKVSEWLASKSVRKKYFKLSQRNIYIFPTSAGFSFLGLLVLMLVTAINYQNSLVYLLTFFLGSIFFISIWMCFLNLSGLEVSTVDVARNFEGDDSIYLLCFNSPDHIPIGLMAGVSKQNMGHVLFNTEGLHKHSLRVDHENRGVHRLERLRLESRFPFGFIIAWTWLKLDAELIVYPKPIFGTKNPVGSLDAVNVNAQLKSDQVEDLKAYQSGDPSSRIIWKKYAAKDELVVRDVEHAVYNSDWVSWSDYDTNNLEAKLSYLCDEVCRLSHHQQRFGFNIPGARFEPETGAQHRQKCLDALALYS